jgi:single-stranded-DNA-specific exonuclease
MDDANVSYCLLTTNSLEEAHSLAEKLEKMNAERQRSTEEALAKVRGELATKEELSLLIEGAEDYPIGVIGLVAGRLMDEFYKPVIILNLGPELCRGSSRSIPEFNIVAALEKCSDLLISFGGHPLAAGFTVARQDLAQLEERLMGLATSQLAYLDLHPGLIIDAEIPLSALAGETFSLMQKLSPFGQANPQPTFLSRNVEVAECRNLGNKGGHLELKLKQENVTWRAVAFRMRKASEEIPPRVDVVYRLEKGWWNGEEMLQLNLRDIAPSRSHP